MVKHSRAMHWLVSMIIGIVLIGCGKSGGDGSSVNGGDIIPPPETCNGIIVNSSQSARLSWTAPDKNTDGSDLTDLAGYRIYFRDESSSFSDSLSIDAGNVTEYVVHRSDLPSGIDSGIYYFAVSSYDLASLESARSDPVCANVTIQ